MNLLYKSNLPPSLSPSHALPSSLFLPPSLPLSLPPSLSEETTSALYKSDPCSFKFIAQYNVLLAQHRQTRLLHSLIFVFPLVSSLTFENLLEFLRGLLGVAVRRPLVLPTVSHTTPAIKQDPQVFAFTVNNLPHGGRSET